MPMKEKQRTGSDVNQPQPRRRSWPADRLPRPGEPQARIEADEVEALLDGAAPEPTLLADARLWRDWLAFLAGAAENGGLLIRS